jgi:hypothetical protein
MLSIRASFREDSKFSPAEAVFGSQLILPGQFINTAESPSLSFLSDLQTIMTGRPATAGAAQRGPSSIHTTRGAVSPLCPSTAGRCAAAAVAYLRRPLPSAGAVNTLLPPRDGG